MDFLQNNLTELLQLIKGGAVCNSEVNAPSAEKAPTVPTHAQPVEGDPGRCNSPSIPVVGDMPLPTTGKKFFLAMMVILTCVLRCRHYLQA